MTTRWTNYSGNLRKIFNIVGPKTSENIWINCIVQQGTDYHGVYSNFFWSCWTNDVEDFPKVTWIISPLSCHLRFSIVVLKTFLIQEERIGNVVSTSHWIRPVLEAAFKCCRWQITFPWRRLECCWFPNRECFQSLILQEFIEFWKSTLCKHVYINSLLS